MVAADILRPQNANQPSLNVLTKRAVTAALDVRAQPLRWRAWAATTAGEGALANEAPMRTSADKQALERCPY
jgi:hypothetical protein